MFIALVPLLGLAVLLVMAARRRPGGLDAVLARAVTAGVITPEQAERILASERTETPGRTRPAERGASAAVVPPVLEGLGYLGSILVLVGAGLLVGQNWSGFALWLQVLVAGGAAVLLTVGGLLVRQDPDDLVRWRLRGFLWMLATPAVALTAGVVAAEGFDLAPRGIAVSAAGAAFVHAALLWWRRDMPAQHLEAFAALAVTVGVTASLVPGPTLVGSALLVLGIAWLAAGHRGLLPPRMVAVALGSVGTLIGAPVLAGEVGQLVPTAGLAAALVLVAVGLRTGEREMSGIAFAGTLVFLPWAIVQWFGDAVGAPAALLSAGAVVLVALVVLLRRRGHGTGMTPV